MSNRHVVLPGTNNFKKSTVIINLEQWARLQVYGEMVVKDTLNHHVTVLAPRYHHDSRLRQALERAITY